MFEETSIEKLMYERIIGAVVLEYVKNCEPQCLPLKLHSGAVTILTEIQEVLDDETLDDPACFQKIEAIVSVFHDHGLYTSRHDFG